MLEHRTCLFTAWLSIARILRWCWIRGRRFARLGRAGGISRLPPMLNFITLVYAHSCLLSSPIWPMCASRRRAAAAAGHNRARCIAQIHPHDAALMIGIVTVERRESVCRRTRGRGGCSMGGERNLLRRWLTGLHATAINCYGGGGRTIRLGPPTPHLVHDRWGVI